MTDTPKKPDQDKPPAKQPLTRAYLESLGFKYVPSSGKGYVLPAHVPPPTKKDAPE